MLRCPSNEYLIVDDSNTLSHHHGGVLVVARKKKGKPSAIATFRHKDDESSSLPGPCLVSGRTTVPGRTREMKAIDGLVQPCTCTCTTYTA